MRTTHTIDTAESVALRGVYRFTLASVVSREARALYAIIERLRLAGIDYLDEVRLLNEVAPIRILEYANLIPTVGRTMIANNLTSTSPTNTMRINYVALGTGVTAPANGDTTLQTETYRNAVASQTNASNIAYATGFFTATETSGTFRETGLFSNGTAAANSGVLFSRVAINITKAVTETLTVDWTITIT